MRERFTWRQEGRNECLYLGPIKVATAHDRKYVTIFDNRGWSAVCFCEEATRQKAEMAVLSALGSMGLTFAGGSK